MIKMKIIDNNKLLDDCKLSKDIIFLDIETTGFSPKKDSIVGFSCASHFSQNKARFTQYFSFEEKAVIEKLLEALIGKNEIVTFGGDKFEFKFIESKLEKYDINFSFKDFILNDIQKSFKVFSKYFDLKENNRAYIENKFNLNKKNSYDMNSIARVLKFKPKNKKTKDKNQADEILFEKQSIDVDDIRGQALLELSKHSEEEIITLIALYDVLDNFKCSHSLEIKKNTHLILDEYDLIGDRLQLVFRADSYRKKAVYYNADFSEISIYKNRIIFTLYIKKISAYDCLSIAYETDCGYIPLIIDNEIIFENINYLISKYKDYLV